MLLEFRVRNFRSFGGEQGIRFPLPAGGASTTTQRAVVFGASGAGKTNLLLALAALRDLVLHSAEESDSQYIKRYLPFEGAVDEPTEFSIEILLDRVRYRYCVSYNSHRVVSERLLVYQTAKPQCWFQRSFDESLQVDRWEPFSPSFHGPREFWRRMTHGKALFLSTARRFDCEQLLPLHRWFEEAFHISLAEGGVDHYSIAQLVKEPILKARLLVLLHAVGSPTLDIRARDGALYVDAIELFYRGGDGNGIWVALADEARGFARLVSLLAVLLPSLARGTFLAVDEFDLGLHPLVARFLIQQTGQENGAADTPQVLLTSHDVALMVPEVLHNNEIWLMERGEDHASYLVPLAHRGPRKREQVMRGYLRGRYGAIPNIQPLLDVTPVEAPPTRTRVNR